MSVCNNCGCTDIEHDQARGDAVCTACGKVLEEGLIVSEVGYVETASGASSALGTFVSREGTSMGRTLGANFCAGIGRESREVTLQNGKRRIANLALQLSLHQHHIDSAFRYFKLALSKRLTRGRKASHIAAACLYLVCRMEGTSHMLLDFSDTLQENVFLLGRAYLRLASALEVQAPALDPCLYIARFAHKLEFGSKTPEVIVTAYRLVARMKRDWMQYGRRPAGLCGAALLVAARLHNFSRSQKDIIRVVRVCDATLKKRLAEFERTPSSSLTIEEFLKIDLEEESDPPSFQQARNRSKASQMDGDFEGEISRLERVIDEDLSSRDAREGFSKGDEASSGKIGNGNSESGGTSFNSATLVTHSSTDPEMTAALSAADFGNVTSLRVYADDENGNSGQSNEDEPLDNLDEDELDSLILTEAEVVAKTRLWEEENWEYLKQLKEKEEREESDRAAGIEKPPKKKRKLKHNTPREPCRTAREAIERVFVEKRLSSKINYDVLRDLEADLLAAEQPVPVSTEVARTSDISSSAPVNEVVALIGAVEEIGQTESVNGEEDDIVDVEEEDDEEEEGLALGEELGSELRGYTDHNDGYIEDYEID